MVVNYRLIEQANRKYNIVTRRLVIGKIITIVQLLLLNVLYVLTGA